jgi:hypothetical protein
MTELIELVIYGLLLLILVAASPVVIVITAAAMHYVLLDCDKVKDQANE